MHLLILLSLTVQGICQPYMPHNLPEFCTMVSNQTVCNQLRDHLCLKLAPFDPVFPSAICDELVHLGLFALSSGCSQGMLPGNWSVEKEHVMKWFCSTARYTVALPEFSDGICNFAISKYPNLTMDQCEQTVGSTWVRLNETCPDGPSLPDVCTYLSNSSLEVETTEAFCSVVAEQDPTISFRNCTAAARAAWQQFQNLCPPQSLAETWRREAQCKQRGTQLEVMFVENVCGIAVRVVPGLARHHCSVAIQHVLHLSCDHTQEFLF